MYLEQKRTTTLLTAPITRSSEPLEARAICRAKAIPSFLSYFKIMSIGPGASFSNVPITFRAQKAVLCLPRLHFRSKFQ